MKEVIECLQEWLELYSDVGEIAPEQLESRTEALIKNLEASIKRKSESLKGKAGRKKTPIKDRRRIAKQKGPLRVVAEANGVSPTSVALWRNEFGITCKKI